LFAASEAKLQAQTDELLRPGQTVTGAPRPATPDYRTLLDLERLERDHEDHW
jgi:hypothetical protein